MDALHALIQDMPRGVVDKVVVRGDFNELGALIEHDHEDWKPLPAEIPNVFGSVHVHDTLNTTHDTADHIWVGGNEVDVSTCTDKKDAAFGSDRCGLSVWGV